MSVYTISPCLIRGCEKNEDIISYRTVLMKFLSGESKVAKDENGWVIDLYGSLPDKHGFISNWLIMMGTKPSRFEKIPVDLGDVETEEGKFIKLCKETKGKHKMIVYSVMNLSGDFDKYKIEENDKKYHLKIDDNNSIELFDKDEAVSELGNEKEVHLHYDSHVSDSVIAGGNVTGSNNRFSLKTLIKKIKTE